jgi:hypothetical protein
MGSHSTWYVDCTSYLWMLARRWSNMTGTCCHNKILIFVHRCCVLTLTLKHFVLILNSKTTFKIKFGLRLNLIWIVRCEVPSAVLRLVQSPDVANDSSAFILKVVNYLNLQIKTLRPSQRLKLCTSRHSVASCRHNHSFTSAVNTHFNCSFYLPV